MSIHPSSFPWLNVAQYVYDEYLSKPYTLKTCTYDWDYQAEGITIPRPNHGLAHTLRTALYVSVVADFYSHVNKTTFTKTEVENLQLVT